METLESPSFGEQCADFVTQETVYLDCQDVQDRDFALEKLNAKVGAIVEVRKTENDRVAERTTSVENLKLQDHIPHKKEESTWFRLYWAKRKNDN